ncbi:hypothetical protein [Carnobacterium maltaromaticum]|uniref:hypothetical protein n=1 Tax=Carnobacterium maltaromaticum TaxID=2751 RepID=UPI00295E7581|nr:hypothetical protein [Carnobacterium maltaromaticum]
MTKSDKELTVEIVTALIISDQVQPVPLKSGGTKLSRALNLKLIDDIIKNVYASIHNLRE